MAGDCARRERPRRRRPSEQRTELTRFDHLLGGREQRRWHFDAEHLSSLAVDDQLEFRRRLDRQVAAAAAIAQNYRDLFVLARALAGTGSAAAVTQRQDAIAARGTPAVRVGGQGRTLNAPAPSRCSRRFA